MKVVRYNETEMTFPDVLQVEGSNKNRDQPSDILRTLHSIQVMR
jgi:hypothetical protein